jgi:hypothetical protein
MQHRYSYVYSLFSIYYCKRHKVAKSSRVWQSGRVSEIADVVLVVDRERFPAHRNGLAARREYFRGLLLILAATENTPLIYTNLGILILPPLHSCLTLDLE